MFLEKPFNKILDTLSNDPDSKLYKRELDELQKLCVSSPLKQSCLLDRNLLSQRDLDAKPVKNDSNLNHLWKKDDI